MQMTCQIQRGFFVLRPCGTLAAAQCQSCGRWCCAEHLRGQLCAECAARTSTDYSTTTYDAYDPWLYGQRNSYGVSVFDQHEVSSFDQSSSGSWDASGEGGESGGDWDAGDGGGESGGDWGSEESDFSDDFSAS